MSESKSKLSIILGIFLLLVSCSNVRVKRTDSNIDLNKTIIFLNYTGDTIIKCQTNDIPDFEVERLVDENSETYYVRLDSTEYLGLRVYSDVISIVTWQIKKRK
jgi:hypothetical protein